MSGWQQDIKYLNSNENIIIGTSSTNCHKKVVKFIKGSDFRTLVANIKLNYIWCLYDYKLSSKSIYFGRF